MERRLSDAVTAPPSAWDTRLVVRLLSLVSQRSEMKPAWLAIEKLAHAAAAVATSCTWLGFAERRRLPLQVLLPVMHDAN
jgi:hypothetical protein